MKIVTNYDSQSLQLSNVLSAKTGLKLISATLILVASLVLLGWMINSAVLKSIFPDLAPMKPNTALSFLLTGLSFWLLQGPQTTFRKTVLRICALIILLIGLLTISEYVANWNLGIDQILFLGGSSGIDSNLRMAEASSVAFTLIGISLLLLIYSRRYIIIQSLGLVVAGIGLIAFAGYLFGVTALYATSPFKMIALHTSLAFCVAGLGLLWSCSQEGFVAEIARNHLGGLMARRLLPAVIIVPLIIGWLRLQGQYLAFYNTEFGLALFAVSNITVLTFIVWWTARQLNQVDVKHQQANRRLERYAQRMNILHDIDRGIVSAKSVSELINETIQELRAVIPCERIGITLLDERQQEFVVYAATSNLDVLNTNRIPVQPYLLEGFDENNIHLVEDLRTIQENLPEIKRLVEIGLQTSLRILLSHNGVIQGYISFLSKTSGFFTSEYREIAVEVAHQIAIVLAQKSLTESVQKANLNLERYARRMEILHNIDRGIIASQDVYQLIETTIKEMRSLIPCEHISVSLVDQAAQELIIYAFAGEHIVSEHITRIPLSPRLWEGFDDDNTRLFEDLRLIPEPNPVVKNLLEQNLVAFLQVRLTQGGQPMGTINLSASVPGFFTPEYREVALEVTSQLAIALKQMRLSESIQKANVNLERYARRMEILHNIDRGIIASQDVHQLIETTIKEVRLIIPCERIAFSLVDETGQVLEIFTVDTNLDNPFNSERLPLVPHFFDGFNSDGTRLFEDLRLVQGHFQFADVLLERGFLSLLQVKITQDDHPIGLVHLAATTVGFFTSEYREIAVEVAHQLSIALKQMHLSEALQLANDTLEQRVIERTAELNAAKEKVEAILNNSLDGILLTNVDMHIEKTNPAFEKLFGRNTNEQAPMSLLDVVQDFDTKRVEASVQNALTGVGHNSIEVRARREDGSSFDVELSIGHIEGDGLVSSLHDITNRKMLERQLLYHASIQNTVADAVIATDLEFNIQSWNKAAELIYGWQADEVIGKPVREILQSEHNAGRLMDEIRHIFIEDGHWTGEVTQRRRDGSTIYMLSSSVLFKDSNGNPFGVLAVNHDITERKQAEDALRQALEREREVNEMKTRFISIASHEFRSPLAAISMLTESLSAYRDKMPPEQIDQRLERIQQQVTHVTSVMDDVLESARMQGDHINFKPVQSNLDKLYREIVEEFAGRPEFNGRIQYSCDESEQLSRFDPRLMRQIFSNLLSNALKYSPANKSAIVKLVLTDRHIILDVSDEGIGIPEEDLKYIFEPFHRAANVGSISGTGLGMSITKKAVEMHGGTIDVKSTVNQGTIFTVVIPMLPT